MKNYLVIILIICFTLSCSLGNVETTVNKSENDPRGISLENINSNDYVYISCSKLLGSVTAPVNGYTYLARGTGKPELTTLQGHGANLKEWRIIPVSRNGKYQLQSRSAGAHTPYYLALIDGVLTFAHPKYFYYNPGKKYQSYWQLERINYGSKKGMYRIIDNSRQYCLNGDNDANHSVYLTKYKLKYSGTYWDLLK